MSHCSNVCAVNCYLAGGYRQDRTRRKWSYTQTAGRPIVMGLLQSEHVPRLATARHPAASGRMTIYHTASQAPVSPTPEPPLCIVHSKDQHLAGREHNQVFCTRR